MAHVTVELHEKYAGEKISDYDHAVVHEEMGAINCTQSGVVDGQSMRVIRGSYLADTILPQDVRRAQQNIERRLGRSASVMVSVGQTYSYGLKPQLTSLFASDSASASSFLTSLMAPPPKPSAMLMAAPPPTLESSYFSALMGITPVSPTPRMAAPKPSNSVWSTVPISETAPMTGLAKLLSELGKNS